MTIPADVSKALEYEIDPAFAARARFICSWIWKRCPSRVLDLGCGRGFYVRLLENAPFIKQVVGLDFSADRLTTARQYARPPQTPAVVGGSAYELPFPPSSFDCVICSEVLEHLCDEAKALDEINRVLTPGGLLIISVPNEQFPLCWDPLNWILMRLFATHLPSHIHWLAGIWADHERLYSYERLRDLISSRFTVTELHSVLRYCWPFSHHLLYGVGKNLVLGCKLRHLNRFSHQSQNWMAKLAASIMRAPSTIVRERTDSQVGVNLVLAANKN